MFRKVLIISIQTINIFLFTSGDKVYAGASSFSRPQVAAPTSDSTLTEKAYFHELQQADEQTFVQDFETYFLLILDNQQKAAYDSLATFDARKEFIRNYWKATNPNPLLPENDWLIDFIGRVDYSKKNFASPRPPYIDDRGWYYIKYGKPRSRWEDGGGIEGLEISNNLRARQYLGLRNPISYTIAANETWSYANIQRDFVVYFKKEGAVFREIHDLKKLLVDRIDVHQIRNSEGPNRVYWFWGDLIKKRASLSPVLGQASDKVMQAEENVIFRVMSYEPPHVTLWRGENDATNQIERARHDMPAAAHDPVQAESTLKLYDRISQFRGLNGDTRIDITLLSPYKKNLVKKFKKSSEDTVLLHFGGMLRDSQFEPLNKVQVEKSIPISLAAKENLPQAVEKLMLSAKSQQQAELTLQVHKRQHEQKERFGFYRQTIDIRDFSGDSLQISDIQISYRAGNDRKKKLLPTWQGEDMSICPYPYLKIRKKTPPLFYFEIYNLPLQNTSDNLEIAYTIFETRDERKSDASVSATYTRPVIGQTMQELIEIDLKNVKKGRHLLEITVQVRSHPPVIATAVREVEVE